MLHNNAFSSTPEMHIEIEKLAQATLTRLHTSQYSFD